MEEHRYSLLNISTNMSSQKTLGEHVCAVTEHVAERMRHTLNTSILMWMKVSGSSTQQNIRRTRLCSHRTQVRRVRHGKSTGIPCWTSVPTWAHKTTSGEHVCAVTEHLTDASDSRRTPNFFNRTEVITRNACRTLGEHVYAYTEHLMNALGVRNI